MTSSARYQPCHILARAGISNVVWFEDLLTRYGSDTVVWEVQLLVADPESAARTLAEAGYKNTPLKIAFQGDVPSLLGGIRMAMPDRDPSTAVLLHRAKDWDCDLASPADNFIPPLEKFMDSIAGYWLSMSDEDFMNKDLLAEYVYGLLVYCYSLKGRLGPIVRHSAFARKLRPEHRELHYELTTDYPGKDGMTRQGHHQYHAMRYHQIKEGKFFPKPYSTNKFPESQAEYPELTRSLLMD
jgi:hypothetical protein